MGGLIPKISLHMLPTCLFFHHSPLKGRQISLFVLQTISSHLTFTFSSNAKSVLPACHWLCLSDSHAERTQLGEHIDSSCSFLRPNKPSFFPCKAGRRLLKNIQSKPQRKPVLFKNSFFARTKSLLITTSSCKQAELRRVEKN